MLVCEAAGFDVVLVETVGVGQSETTVAEMVDFFLVLMLAGAGDELQGIKRGILEIADLIAVNKADGDNLAKAKRAVRDYRAALRFLTPRGPHWQPRVTACSALTGAGLDDIWRCIREHRDALTAGSEWTARRRAQMRGWMWAQVEEALKARLHGDPAIKAIIEKVEADLKAGTIAPASGAQTILTTFLKTLTPG